MNDNDLIDRERRGQRAKEFVNHTEMAEAFQKVRQQYMEATLQCAPTDDKGRHNLVLAAVIVDKVRDHIGRVIQDGELATKELEEIRQTHNGRRKVLGIV